MQLYSAVLKAQLGGGVELTSVSGFSRYRINQSVDLTPSFGSGFPNNYNFDVNGTVETAQSLTEKFTQELRLSGSWGNRLDWILGVFYDHERTPTLEDILAEDPSVGVPVGNILHYDLLDRFSEYAAFTDVTIHFTNQFDVQVGGRASHNHQNYDQSSIGPYNGTPAAQISPQADSGQTAFTYLVAPRYRISPDLVVYARLASGYRPGGPNENVGIAGVPSSYRADTTENYEIGVKAEALDHRISVTTSLYYIDWHDIQLSLYSPNGFNYYDNGSGAKSEGVELSVDARPVRGLTASAWVTWNEAILTQAFPVATDLVAAPGDWLPYSSRYSGNISLQQAFPLGGDVSGYVAGTASYVGERRGAFTYNDVRQDLPGYAKTDLKLGVKWNTWEVSVYGNNVMDKRGLLNGGIGSFNPEALFYIQPRTVGATITKEF